MPASAAIRTVCATGALALLFAGCGGGAGGGGGEATFDPGPATVAKPGTTFALGERAFVRYSGLGAKLEPTVETTLGVTVEKVDEGDSSDIEDLGDNVVPWYVHVEYENHGDAPIHAGAGPGGRFKIRGSDGEEYDRTGTVTISGEFDACPSVDAQATLARDEAIADCVVVGMKEGVTPKQVRFTGDYAAMGEPIGWTVD
jgi:hypothetical protein